MARRARNDLDELFEAWARWCANGAYMSGSSSLLARWMDGRGHMVFGSGGAPSVLDYPVEERIEAAVMSIARDDLLSADVLRLEYSAGYPRVVRRRRIRGYDPRNIGQAEKALALGVSVRTYRRRLAIGREYVEWRLAETC